MPLASCFHACELVGMQLSLALAIGKSSTAAFQRKEFYNDLCVSPVLVHVLSSNQRAPFPYPAAEASQVGNKQIPFLSQSLHRPQQTLWSLLYYETWMGCKVYTRRESTFSWETDPQPGVRDIIDWHSQLFLLLAEAPKNLKPIRSSGMKNYQIP